MCFKIDDGWNCFPQFFVYMAFIKKFLIFGKKLLFLESGHIRYHDISAINGNPNNLHFLLPFMLYVFSTCWLILQENKLKGGGANQEMDFFKNLCLYFCFHAYR